MEYTRRSATNVPEPRGGRSPMNAFFHMRAFPDHRFTAIVRPNADTLYSGLWFDVSREPLIVDVPDSRGRYYVMTALDMWTDQFSSTGTRTTGGKAQTIAFVGADWRGDLPADAEEIRCPTAQGWILVRMQTNGAADYDFVRAFQNGLSAAPLSRFGRSTPAPPAAVDESADMKTPPPLQVKALDAAGFFGAFARGLRLNRPHANDYPIVQRMRRLGLTPGADFDLAKAPAAVRTACLEAMTSGPQRLKGASTRAAMRGDGWRINVGAMGAYGIDYVQRAAVAFWGLGAIGVDDAVYPAAYEDSAGRPLDAQANYVMHFTKERLPPARAFWSLTMYNDRQYFADNPIQRYAIGDRDPLVFNPDGSLDLYIQRESPGAGRESNWLPTPESGRFSMNMRLYWPDVAVLDGKWFPPPVERVS
ncbi:MAG: DUF1254 domain-containing protein [Hyphomicrobiales bacterium]|nr:DUF1254 domain-containing protein [Hyphomicrobiales bacterium]